MDIKNAEIHDKRPAILYVLDGFQFGGVATFVGQYAKIAIDSGYQVIIIGCSGDIERPDEMYANCEVIRVPGMLKYPFINRLTIARKYIQVLHNIYRVYNVKVIHFSTIWSTCYSLLHPHTWYIRRVSTLYGLEQIEILSTKRKTDYSMKIKAVIYSSIQRLQLICSHHIIVFSNASLNLISGFLSSVTAKTIVIGPYVQPCNFENSNKKKKDSVLRILNIGRAERRKGIHILLAALSILKKVNLPLTLTIASPVIFLNYAGIYDCYEHLNLFNSVHFLHKVDNQQKEKLYKNADLFIMPSIAGETFGLAALEALAHGIPVIGSDDCTLPEILGKIDTRLIVPKNNPRLLAKAIVWYYYLSTAEMRRLSRKSINMVKKYYTYERVKHDLLKVYGKTKE